MEDFNTMMGKLIGKPLSDALAENKLKNQSKLRVTPPPVFSAFLSHSLSYATLKPGSSIIID